MNIPLYKTDFESYARDFLKIRDKDAKISSFLLNPVQRHIINSLNLRKPHGRCFLYVLKARQTGVSTLAEGLIFHRAHLTRDQQAVIIANDADGAENVYNMSRRFLDNMPVAMQPMVRYTSKRQLVFENPSKLERFDDPGMRSRIEVFTAGRDTAGRSFNFNVAHLSEFGFFASGKELVTSLIPALPNVSGNFVIMETTANGADNFAYDEWHRFKDKYQEMKHLSDLIPIFVAWYDDPTSVQEFYDSSHMFDFQASMRTEAREYMTHYALSLNQMLWRDTQTSAMGGDEFAFIQEYPSNDEEAFLVTGRPVFQLRHISTARMGLPDRPLFKGTIHTNGSFTSDDFGSLQIFHDPQRGREYVISVDTKGISSEYGDEAAIQVLDKETLTQVAEWSGYLDPIALSPVVRALAVHYRSGETADTGALVVVERNNSGQSMIYELQKNYYNIYRRESMETMGVKISTQDLYGWDTNIRTKPMIIDFATFCFHNSYCKVNSEKLLNQMSKFSAVDNSGKASKGAKDDTVMAWMIGLFVAGKEKSDFFSILQSNPDRPRKRTAEEMIVSGAYTDKAEIDLDEYDDRDDSKNSWMEY